MEINFAKSNSCFHQNDNQLKKKNAGSVDTKKVLITDKKKYN